MLETIKNYRKITDKLHTAAQPTVDEFESIKQAGIEVVINLARADSPDAIINEVQIAQENGLDYINIPVDFKKPDRADLSLFFNTMEQHIDNTILVHCAFNWRVSCFVYLYRVIKQDCDNETAKQDMLAIWQPDETWQSFIDDCLSDPENIK
jgi:protein tyrosine phosphatase (PTP) superfamily phosphohydrolase (DUF442 family)